MNAPLLVRGGNSDIGEDGEGLKEDLSHELRQRVAAIRRQLPVLLISILAAIVAGIAIISALPRLYTASAFVLIDSRRVRAVEGDYDNQGPAFDGTTSYVESQVEVVKSGHVAEAVVKNMNLVERPLPDAYTPFSLLMNAFTPLMDIFKAGAGPEGEGPAGRQRLLQRTIPKVQSWLEVRHVPRTMVLQIFYTATKPTLAAEMANAYAEAYINDQLNAKYEVTRRASDWLETRLAELKQKALDSDLAVQKFREDNNLISSSGKLVNEQQITELNTQLVNARAERARAEARHARLRSIIASHETDAVVSDAFGSGIIEHLRSKYLEASKRQAELEARVGAEHASVIGLRQEMREYERQIFSELSRLEEAYRSEVNIARVRETALSENLERLLAVAAKENKLLVTLHELQQQGDSSRTLYQTYLQRYQESLQQQSFPIVEARVITPAYEPQAPSHPRKTVLTLVFALLGGFVGSCIGFVREMRESGFRSQEQVRSELRLESLGIVPQIPDDNPPSGKASAKAATKDIAAKPAMPSTGKVISRSRKNFDYILDYPNSAMGEALLATKLAVDIRYSRTASKIIAVTSAMPGEGKTVISKNLASLLASRQANVLLIDGDLRRRDLSRALVPQAASGLLEAIMGERDMADMFHTEPQTGLKVLPAANRHQISHSADILASPGMQRLLTRVKSEFDYVVIDLPPLGPVIDARAIAPHVDAFVLTIEWRKTPRRMIRNLLREDAVLGEKCIGAILNKVEVEKIKLYEDYGSKFYPYDAYVKAYYLDK